jgi:hypothetical protein
MLKIVEGFEKYRNEFELSKGMWNTSKLLLTLIQSSTNEGKALLLNSGRWISKKIEVEGEINVGFGLRFISNEAEIQSKRATLLSLMLDEQLSMKLSLLPHGVMVVSVPSIISITTPTKHALHIGDECYIELKYASDRILLRIHKTENKTTKILDLFDLRYLSSLPSVNKVKFGSTKNTSLSFSIDDMYVCDSKGKSCNNLLGEMKVETYDYRSIENV